MSISVPPMEQTPVYISVLLCDVTGVEILIAAGADSTIADARGAAAASLAEERRRGRCPDCGDRSHPPNADLNSLILQLAFELLPEIQIAAPAGGADDGRGLVSRELALPREALKHMSTRLAMIQRGESSGGALMSRLGIRVKDVEHHHKLSVRIVVERSVAPGQRRRICTRDA
jgi:hypothetical protein